MAQRSGATVITTVSSPEKALLAAAADADHVINYRTQDVVAEIGKIAPWLWSVINVLTRGRLLARSFSP